MSRLPQDFYSAIEILDAMGDGGDVYRPTEVAALINISYERKNKNIKEIMQPQRERSAIKRFHLNVQEIVDILNHDGSLNVISNSGMRSVKHPQLIASELQNRGYIWIFASHVREAQSRLLFKEIVHA